MSMDSDISTYKRKVDHMTLLVRHYQTELESQKVRRDGVETVSQLLAESRQENFLLRQNQMAMETLIKNLQNRLTSSGLTLTSDAEEEEVIVPGTSKQTLTNLVLENKRLRSILQEPHVANVDCHRISSEDTEIEQSTKENLEAENKNMIKKTIKFEELPQLRGQEKGSSESASDKTSSMEYGAYMNVLKELLHAFICKCEDFATQLDHAEQSVVKKTEIDLELPSVPKQAVERSDSVDAMDVQQLLEEKQKLQDRVEDVTRMNQRWQEFYSEREKYTQQLEEKVCTLDERLKEAMRSGPTGEISRRLDSVLDKYQKEMKQVEDMRRKAEEQAQHLEQELGQKNKQVAQLQSQLTILSRTPAHQSPVDNNSTIEHLKAQIQVCTEDFEKERQDRQVALQKVASLHEQNTHLQKQIIHLQKLNSHLQTLLRDQSGQNTRPAGQNTRPAAKENIQQAQQDVI